MFTPPNMSRAPVNPHPAVLHCHARPFLTADVAAAAERLIEECCHRHGRSLIAVETGLDHVPVFVSAPPRWSPAQIATVLKGSASRNLRERFPDLKRACGREQLWTQAYYVGTAGRVSAEMIRHYVEDCQGCSADQ